MKMIPLSFPTLGESEARYVMDCLQSTWISSAGNYLDRFESAFAAVAGTKHAISCSNGTAALHLALLALGVKPDDEVIVPTLTFVACANAVIYCGAKPVLLDVDPGTWCLDPSLIESQITRKTRGIIAVHLRGHQLLVGDPALEDLLPVAAIGLLVADVETVADEGIGVEVDDFVASHPLDEALRRQPAEQ